MERNLQSMEITGEVGGHLLNYWSITELSFSSDWVIFFSCCVPLSVASVGTMNEVEHSAGYCWAGYRTYMGNSAGKAEVGLIGHCQYRDEVYWQPMFGTLVSFLRGYVHKLFPVQEASQSGSLLEAGSDPPVLTTYTLFTQASCTMHILPWGGRSAGWSLYFPPYFPCACLPKQSAPEEQKSSVKHWNVHFAPCCLRPWLDDSFLPGANLLSEVRKACMFNKMLQLWWALPLQKHLWESKRDTTLRNEYENEVKFSYQSDRSLPGFLFLLTLGHH